MLLLVDNFDSFTYNLVQAFQVLNRFPVVRRNNAAELLELARRPELQGLILSPGPGKPKDSGLCLELLGQLPKHTPVLGVCLGHQILAEFAGCQVVRAGRIMHGKTSAISHCGQGLFAGLSNPFTATRYHSLIMELDEDRARLPVTITARSEAGEPMGLAYGDRPWAGVQFHPESILTREGPKLLENFLLASEQGAQVGSRPANQSHIST